jgi:MazG family protein
MAAIDRVLAVMARLRDPQTGCPWDVAQDFRSIAPHTVEEAYEVADAIERGDFDDLRDELGDLLLQVVYHARMAEERDAFDFEAVADGLAAKLIRRHPHVFGEKAEERAERGESDPSALAGVTLGLPALTRAQKLSRRAARAGFDWPDASGPAAKVREELEEIAAAGEDPDAREAEVGDLLFAAVNLARHLDVDAETALRRAGQRFERRFRAVEGHARRDGGGTAGMPMDTLQGYWQAAKRDE